MEMEIEMETAHSAGPAQQPGPCGRRRRLAGCLPRRDRQWMRDHTRSRSPPISRSIALNAHASPAPAALEHLHLHLPLQLLTCTATSSFSSFAVELGQLCASQRNGSRFRFCLRLRAA